MFGWKLVRDDHSEWVACLIRKSNSFEETKTLLRKYADGADISREDKDLVNELARIGLLRIGYSLRRRQSTARTTRLGMKVIS